MLYVLKDTGKKPTTISGKKFICPTCNKCFKTESVMKGHITKFHKVTTPKLLEKETKKHMLNEHETVVSSGSESDRVVYKCDECNFKTINKTKFKKHKKSHINSSKSNSPEKRDQNLLKTIQRP